jgi:hypothetical protein
MNKKNFFAPLYLVIFVLFATMVGCSSKDEKSEVIERRSSTSTSTTIESPVMQEKKTTTTTPDSRYTAMGQAQEHAGRLGMVRSA